MISAIVLTRNEEKNIEACLDSLSWCDERIVIDDYSEDKTVDIAKKKGAKVFHHTLQNDFAQQRNFALTKANGDWILFVDADERVSSALWYEIMQRTNESLEYFSGFYIKRQDTMWGKLLRHGETGNITLLRLAKKDAGKWEGQVHEEWKVSGKTLTLQNYLDHYPHTTITEFLKEINFYTDLRAQELFKKKKTANWFTIIFYPKSKFVLNYFIKGGYQDGLPGFVFAMMMSLHSFLVRSKLWLLWEKAK
ncbi:MAG: glycosyltransferase family 2 protein [Candidatus Levyibacteriota bacterium]